MCLVMYPQLLRSNKKWGYEDFAGQKTIKQVKHKHKNIPCASQWLLFGPFGQLASSSWQECWNLSRAVWCWSCLRWRPLLHRPRKSPLVDTLILFPLFSPLLFLFHLLPHCFLSCIPSFCSVTWKPGNQSGGFFCKWNRDMFALGSLHIQAPHDCRNGHSLLLIICEECVKYDSVRLL